MSPTSRYAGAVLHPRCGPRLSLCLCLAAAGLGFTTPAYALAGPDDGDEGDPGSEAAEGEDAEGEDAGADEGDGEGSEAAGSEAGPEAPAGDPAAAPMVEIIPQDKRVRHDWYVGFGFGGGVSIVDVTTDNDLGLSTKGVKYGTSGFIHGGGRIREAVYMGARVATINGGALGGTSLLVEALFFPLPKRGLMLGAAIGPSLLYRTKNPTAMAAVMARRDGVPGLGFAADVGYDFWLLRRFNLGIIAQFNGALNPRQGRILGATLGLQFNWY